MTLSQSFKSVLFANYANFSGRAIRSEYWWFSLFNFILLIGLMATAGILNSSFILIMYVVVFVATFIPGLAVSVRRLHDTDRTGWWILLTLVPFGFIVLIVWFALRGTAGPNSYGTGKSATTISMKTSDISFNSAD